MKYFADLTKNRTSKDNSIMGKILDFKKELVLHEQNNLNVYKKHPQLTACDREVIMYNRHTQQKMKTMMFGSNSYLGATVFTKAIQKAIEVVKEFGIGTGGVPLLTGTTIYQEDLEHLIAKISGTDDSIIFSSGYTANLGVVSGLMRPNNLIIHDKLNHASLLDGSTMSGAQMKRYKHGDMKDLERILKENHPLYPHGMLIVTDGVFSMDGDIAKLPEILSLAKKYEAILLIDEAHATGVIGEKGAGTLSHYGITERENIILSGSLSKAIGTVGGYITGPQEIIDYLRVYARSNMFSTSLPPSVCAAAIEVLKIMQTTDIVEQLKKNTDYTHNKLRKYGFNILDTETPIIPLIVGNQDILNQMAKDAFDCGFVINPIFPPAVPANLTRFRISIMASHTTKDIDILIELIVNLFEKYNVSRYVK